MKINLVFISYFLSLKSFFSNATITLIFYTYELFYYCCKYVQMFVYFHNYCCFIVNKFIYFFIQFYKTFK